MTTDTGNVSSIRTSILGADRGFKVIDGGAGGGGGGNGHTMEDGWLFDVGKVVAFIARQRELPGSG